jgi:hypothetical protein
MISIWKLIYDLEYWIHIHTDDDIVNCPDNRREYQHLVQEFKASNIPAEKIPGKVLVRLKKEAELSWLRRPTTWALVRLWFKNLIR